MLECKTNGKYSELTFEHAKLYHYLKYLTEQTTYGTLQNLCLKFSDDKTNLKVTFETSSRISLQLMEYSSLATRMQESAMIPVGGVLRKHCICNYIRNVGISLKFCIEENF